MDHKTTTRDPLLSRRPSDEQLAFASALAIRHKLEIPRETFFDYDFCSQFLNLFAYDPDSNVITGFRRIEVIENYLYYDKDQTHLQFKLDLTQEEVVFMVRVLAEYKYKGAMPRENLRDKDPEGTSYRRLEENILLKSL